MEVVRGDSNASGAEPPFTPYATKKGPEGPFSLRHTRFAYSAASAWLNVSLGRMALLTSARSGW
jgi:hypothetical protein